ncbi:MAG: helix-turn-helix domain-containing protein [Candidatus Brocadiales bacterium]|nr:helix-turn-helix domain-containing protein [Candidatus Brocadiales bacterium]
MKRTEDMKSSAPKANKRLYTVDESAIYLGRSVWSIRELIYNGHLPCIKVGRRVHLDINDLDTFIEQNKMTYTY